MIQSCEAVELQGAQTNFLQLSDNTSGSNTVVVQASSNLVPSQPSLIVFDPGTGGGSTTQLLTTTTALPEGFSTTEEQDQSLNGASFDGKNFQGSCV